MNVLFFLLFHTCQGLWKRGIVHYSINSKDYDLHSQDEIISTFAKIQEETCIKFFKASPYNGSLEKILDISNPDKLKTCPPKAYDFSKNVVLMPIGYKCLNQRDITRIIVDMLRGSIENAVSPVNSYDLNQKFIDLDDGNQTLLSEADRNYINGHYFEECGSHSQRVSHRRSGDEPSSLSEENIGYYSNKLWPMGIVLYGVEEELRGTPDHNILSYAMTTIELATCVVFQEIRNDKILAPKSMLWFSSVGEDVPAHGVWMGNQSIKLSSMTHGAPGHTAHTINNLLRSLGLHMTSNRYDRDNYVTINWKNIQKGKEGYLERAPEESWLSQIQYDFDSVSHAPANFMCDVCDLGAVTVQPIQDHLWQRTLKMGHTTVLTESDRLTVNLLYSEQCRNRIGGK